MTTDRRTVAAALLFVGVAGLLAINAKWNKDGIEIASWIAGVGALFVAIYSVVTGPAQSLTGGSSVGDSGRDSSMVRTDKSDEAATRRAAAIIRDAQARADQIVAEARGEADQIVAAARREVVDLTAQKDKVVSQLEAMLGALPGLAPGAGGNTED